MSGDAYTVKDVCTLLKIKLKPRVSIYIYRTIFFILEGVAETASLLSVLPCIFLSLLFPCTSLDLPRTLQFSHCVWADQFLSSPATSISTGFSEFPSSYPLNLLMAPSHASKPTFP